MSPLFTPSKNRPHPAAGRPRSAAGVFGYTKREYIEQIPIGCAFKAKAVCAGVFVSGPGVREDRAPRTSGFNPVFKLLKAKIDLEKKTVTCSLLGTGLFKKKAVYVDGLGPVLLSGVAEEDRPGLKPDMPEPRRPIPPPCPGPRAISCRRGPPRSVFDAARLERAVDRVFAEPDPEAAQKDAGRRRRSSTATSSPSATRRGSTKDTPAPELVHGQELHQRPGRHPGQAGQARHPCPGARAGMGNRPAIRGRAITIDQLMRMSSGLEWYEDYAEHPVSDVNRMLFLEPDMAAYAASKKPCRPARTRSGAIPRGRPTSSPASSATPLGGREAYLGFPAAELFDRIGMRSAGLGRGRLGHLHRLLVSLRHGPRLRPLRPPLPERRRLERGAHPARRLDGLFDDADPQGPEGHYGAFFWPNRGRPGNPETRRIPNMPTDLFWADGYQGQEIFVCPVAEAGRRAARNDLGLQLGPERIPGGSGRASIADRELRR